MSAVGYATRDPNSEDPRERHRARFHLDQANAAFDEFTDESGAEHLGSRRLQDDRNELEAMTDKVVRYANAMVAHVERNPEDVEVTYDDFNNAIDHLGEMLRRYFLLIDQGGLLSANPTIQGAWKGPFRRPLA